jgi:hypothetical protein
MNVISLGAGVQSTTMALMAAHGELTPMPDAAIFADTQWEPRAVYDHLAWLRSGDVLPFPVHVVTAGDIRAHAIGQSNTSGGRFASIPWYSVSPKGADGIGRRQCTREYKVEPLAKKQRELLGYAPRKRIPAGAMSVWIGISLDEAIRMKSARNAWQVNRWPLVEQRMTRRDCLRWLERNGYPKPPKSSCIGCPFHSNDQWRALTPEEFADAVEVDKQIRTPPKMRGRQYMHPSRKPLDEVDLSTAEERGQLTLFINECEGLCGV